MPEVETVSVTPAQLSFLAIYNSSLGSTDETLSNQIVFYFSKTSRSRQKSNPSHDAPSGEDKVDTNERLRQIGLAQGMVNFAKNFSRGKPVESVDTERSRIVLHELEKDWWILASIDLTRLLSNSIGGTSSPSGSSTPPSVEYSLREVYPPHSLLQQLRRAHSIFLLHHDISLDGLYQRVGRSTFCKFLSRFWTRFIRHWVVLLNGNPAVDIFNGVKLAAGGELGIGVGEEEWGSGEREVLEDFVSRTDGLVDLVVSRFGDALTSQGSKLSPKKSKITDSSTDQHSWLGSDQYPQPSDGVIFSGVDAISRRSLCQVSQWMEWIYRYGDAAYGVSENPSSVRRRKQRRKAKAPITAHTPSSESHKRRASENTTRRRSTSPGIPPPLVVASPPAQAAKVDKAHGEMHNTQNGNGGLEDNTALFGTETLVKYLTLGYGSAWKFPSMSSSDPSQPTEGSLKNETHSMKGSLSKNMGDETQGKFIIGLRDDLEENTSDDESASSAIRIPNQEADESWNNRTLLRTLHLEMVKDLPSHHNEGKATFDYRVTVTNDGAQSLDAHKGRYKKLQVLVYVHQPFMFTFLFDLRTPSLTLPSFYRSIHHQLGPLQRPLLSSTSPLNISRRIYAAECDAGSQKRASTMNNLIYDLVYDSSNLTVRSSIPNIPEPGAPPIELTLPERHPQWSRMEALNVHNQFLSIYTDTRSRPLEIERTCKTSRGWWLVWVRIHDTFSAQSEKNGHDDDTLPSTLPKEAFLVRKSSDSLSHRHAHMGSSSRFFRDLSGVSIGPSSSSSSSPSYQGVSVSMSGGTKLAEGLGFDAQRYIESLLSLNR